MDGMSSTAIRVLLTYVPTDSNCKQMIPHRQSSKKHTWYSITILVSQGCCDKVPKLGGLKQQKFIVSQFRRLQVQNKGFCWVVFSLAAVRENPSMPLLAFGVCCQALVFMCLQMHHSRHKAVFTLGLHIVFPHACGSVSKFLLSIKTSVILG